MWLCGFSPSGPDASLGALATQTGSGIRSGVADRGTWIFVVPFFSLTDSNFLMRKLLNSANKTQCLASNVFKI